MPKVLRIHNSAPLLPINRSEGKVFPKKSDGDPRPGSRLVPVRPLVTAEIRYFGRHHNGMIRDAVLRSVTPLV
jgi:hypothetical protein